MPAPLPYGPSGLLSNELGTGPGGDTGSPRWSGTLFAPASTTIVADMAAVRANAMRIMLNLAGARTTFTDPVTVNGVTTLQFNMTKWQARITRWTVAGGATTAVADAITNAFADWTALAFVIDEPQHTDFGGSITPEIANSLGLFFRSLWPTCLTVLRMDYDKLTAFGAPSGGWTGYDYGVAQYESAATGGTGGVASQTFSQYFTAQKAGLLTLDMGMIPNLNHIDGGLKASISDGVNACWDVNANGSSGIKKGSYSGTLADGTFIQCGTAPSTENRFFANPEWIKRFADVMFSDADAPMVCGFSAWSTPSVRTTFLATANRSDVAAAFDYALNKFATRPTFNGLRVAKGQSPAPATVGVQRIGTASSVGTSVTPPAHVAGDLLVFTAVCATSATIPGLPAGKTSVGTASGNLVGIRKGYLIAPASGQVSGTWTNATSVTCDVYRGTHPTTPFGATANGAFNSTSVSYPGLTLTVVTGYSWVHAGAVHATATNLATTLPTGMLNRGNVDKEATFDSNGGQTGWSGSTVTVNTSGGSRTIMSELIADPAGVPPPVNHPPTITAIPDKTVQEQSLLTFTASATDIDGDTINYTLLPGTSPVPTGAILGLTSGVFTWTPTTPQVGTYNLRVRATDVTGTNPQFPFIEATVNITVTDIPGSPDTGGTDQTFATVKLVAQRAQVDLQSAKALAALLDQTQQMNANVIDQVRALVADLQYSFDYMQQVIDTNSII